MSSLETTTVKATTLEETTSGSVTVAKLLNPWAKVSSQPAVADANINFTGLTVYDEYMIKLDSILPASDGVTLLAQLYQATIVVTSGDYKYHTSVSSAGADTYVGISNAGVGVTTAFSLSNAIGNVAGEEYSGVFELLHLRASKYPCATWRGTFQSGTPVTKIGIGAGKLQIATVADGIRFAFSTGNIASGDFTLFGRDYV